MNKFSSIRITWTTHNVLLPLLTLDLHHFPQSLPLLHSLLFEARHVTTPDMAWEGSRMPHCSNTYLDTQPDANPCSAINKGAVGQNHNSGRMSFQNSALHQHSTQHNPQGSEPAAKQGTAFFSLIALQWLLKKKKKNTFQTAMFRVKLNCLLIKACELQVV